MEQCFGGGRVVFIRVRSFDAGSLDFFQVDGFGEVKELLYLFCDFDIWNFDVIWRGFFKKFWCNQQMRFSVV